MRRRPYDIDHEDYAIVHKLFIFRCCLLLLSTKRKVHEISICIHFTINIYRWHYNPNENEQFRLLIWMDDKSREFFEGFVADEISLRIFYEKMDGIFFGI